MTERGAQFLNRGRRSAKSSREAWEDIKSRNEETDWNLREMIAERERQLEGGFIAVDRQPATGTTPDGRSDDSTRQ